MDAVVIKIYIKVASKTYETSPQGKTAHPRGILSSKYLQCLFI